MDRSRPIPRLSRREWLALGAAGVPATLLLSRPLRAEKFSEAPLAPEAARSDVTHRFWRDLLDEFPLEPGHLHFDAAAYGIPPLQSLEAMHKTAVAVGATASELDGVEVEQARLAIAGLLQAQEAEVALATSVTAAMADVAEALPVRPKATLVLSTHASAAGAAPWLALGRSHKLGVHFFQPRFDFERDRKSVVDHLTKGSLLVLPHVSPATGQLFPIAEMAEMARKRGAVVVVQGDAAIGAVPADVGALGADAYVGSGSTWLLGPVGTAFLWVRPDLMSRLTPRRGRVDQRRWKLLETVGRASDLETSPLSAPLAACLHASIEWLRGLGLDVVRAQSRGLAARLRSGLVGIEGIEVLTPEENPAPIVTFRVTRRPNTQVVDWLRETYDIRLHRVDQEQLNAVRVSTSILNQASEVDTLTEGARRLAL